jgi:hypothetical protein
MLLERKIEPLPLCRWRMNYPPDRFPEVWDAECPHCPRDDDDEIEELLREIFGEDAR